MVKVVGFTDQEELLIRGLIDRFARDGFQVGALARVEKDDRADYEGIVLPLGTSERGRLDLAMYLGSCTPFTIAHELAHVSDIAVRHQETLDHLSGSRPAQWHVAHRMTSEYYANRIACAYAEGDDAFRAFRSDAAGLVGSVAKGDWAFSMVYYSLLLGILHGIGRMTHEPLKMLRHEHIVPPSVRAGMTSFRGQATVFFDCYGGLMAA